MPTGALQPPEEAVAGEQAAHEAETAALALAVLVRLTAHAGRLPATLAHVAGYAGRAHLRRWLVISQMHMQ